MARHADVEPVMDSGSQIDDFDSHGKVLCNSQGSRAISQRTQATPFRNGAFEISVHCGDVTHRWAAQQCLIRMVRLQWIALLATSRQAWGKALLLHLVKRRSTCGWERSNDSSMRDV